MKTLSIGQEETMIKLNLSIFKEEVELGIHYFQRLTEGTEKHFYRDKENI